MSLNKSFTIIIKGKNANDAADELVRMTNNLGKKRERPESEKGTRSFDFIAFVDFFKDAAPVVITIAVPIQLAHTIWQWRRTIKQDVSAKKGEEEGIPTEIPLRKDDDEDELEAFLEELFNELDDQ